MRLATWKSFIRIAALELDRQESGLRRVLILLHNLLTAARLRPPGFETVPDEPQTPSTEQLRQAILAAPQAEQEPMALQALALAAASLEQSDARLQALLEPGAPWFESGPVLVSRGRFLVSAPDGQLDLQALAQSAAARRWAGKAVLASAPAYLLALTCLFARQLGDQTFQAFARLPLTLQAARRFDMEEFSLAEYTTHYRLALRLSQEHGVPFPFVRPFSHRPARYPLRKRALQSLQGWQIRRLLEAL
jgi:hypothetical protein